MDLAYLTRRHRAAIGMATAAAGTEARCIHRRMADLYAVRIDQLRRSREALSS